jgi:hypothetical protein
VPAVLLQNLELLAAMAEALDELLNALAFLANDDAFDQGGPPGKSVLS